MFEPTDRGARTSFSLATRFQSYPGMGHGGILSGILDETMAYAGIFHCRCLPVTRKLEVSFRAKVPSVEEHHCEASVVSRSETAFEAQATIRNTRGIRLMSARGNFAILSGSAAEKLLCGAHLLIWD